MDGSLDMSEYLTGRVSYSDRQGSLSFIVVNGFEYWEPLRMKIVETLHGKKMKMQLLDDPDFFYEGRFTVGNWETGKDYSTITIGYQLNPYKLRIEPVGSRRLLWDPFNFDLDNDYSDFFYPGIVVSGKTDTYYIHAGEYSFVPKVIWVSGEVTVSFGGVEKTLSSSGSATLGASKPGENALVVSGEGEIRIEWREGYL